MRIQRITRRFFQTTLVLAAFGLALGGPALADSDRSVKGESVLEEKNAGDLTLQLDDVLLQLTEDTRLYNGGGQRISFEKIPDPERVQSMVEYSGKLTSKETVVANRVVVRVVPQ